MDEPMWCLAAIRCWYRENEANCRIAGVSGIGPSTAFAVGNATNLIPGSAFQGLNRAFTETEQHGCQAAAA
jgi:hypothetical protein